MGEIKSAKECEINQVYFTVNNKEYVSQTFP